MTPNGLLCRQLQVQHNLDGNGGYIGVSPQTGPSATAGMFDAKVSGKLIGAFSSEELAAKARALYVKNRQLRLPLSEAEAMICLSYCSGNW
jgi:hypothetical protein